jgi:polar amino acid transport system substrate-binding protein
MRITIIARSLLATSVIFMSLPTLIAAAGAQTPISIRGDDWLPISGDGARGERGLMADIAEAALAIDGKKLDYRMQSWDSAVEDVRAGKADCIVGALKSDAPDFVFPKQPWTVSKQTVYSSNSKQYQVGSIDDLKKIKLGVSLDYSYGDALDAYIQENLARPSLILAVPSTNRPLRSLFTRALTGQIDGFLETNVVAEENLRRARLTEQLVARGSPVQEEDLLYIACSPAKASSKALVEGFDSQLAAMRADGRLQAILDKYGMKDWGPR